MPMLELMEKWEKEDRNPRNKLYNFKKMNIQAVLALHSSAGP